MMESNRREQEMRRRREEQRRLAQRRQERKTEAKRKKRNFMLMFMLCVLLIGGIITAAFTILFPIKTILVEGESRYSAEEIIAAAAIEKGSNLLRLSPQKTEDNIRSVCPYISNVELHRKLPSKVIVSVTDSGPALAFVAGENYLLSTVDYEYIVTSEFSEGGIEIYGIAVSADIAGQPIAFADQTAYEQLKQLMDELSSQSINDITKIDFTNPQEIRLQYKDQHIWKLGDLSNLTYKLQFGAEVSKKEASTGTIDLSGLANGKSGYFKSEVLGEFVETVTATDISTVTSTDIP